MKHLTAKLVAGAALTVLSTAVAAGIADTKHNLSDAGLITQANSFSGTDEICVFCHTPHGADVNVLAVPLWNRKLDTTGFSTYDTLGTSTLDGQVLAVGSVSIACLSCHDGTQAMNVMINAPGSGNYNPAGFTLPPATGGWDTDPAATASPEGSLDYATASIVNIGKDLTNDHPIGIAYGGGGITTSATTGPTTDADFFLPDYDATGEYWWVETGTASSGRQKTDLILYNRTFTAGEGPSVECASCHDPHTEDQPTFLRTSNAASALCVACHNK